MSLFFRVVIGIVFCAFIASCNIRPVYGPLKGTYGVDQVTEELASISIQKASNRVAQQLRNRLIFNFNRGRSTREKRYNLIFSVAKSDDAVAIEEFSGAPSSYRLTLIVRYQLIDQQTGLQITQGTVRASASYDRSSQSFANLRAQRDAENRTALMAADEVTIRLSTYFANQL